MTLATQIILGLLLGIAVGLFFGEPAGMLHVVGDAFVRLLQMTVLPYVVVSLVAGLGSIEATRMGRLALAVGGMLLLLWAFALVMVVAMPLAFPELVSASFFSTTLVQPAPAIDFVGLYIPSNPFHSLAHNIVPAVVLFSIALGVAVVSLPDKQTLIAPLRTLGAALGRVNAFVVRLAPIGVFAIGASAAGTLTVQEFQRVQVYVVTYVAFSLALSLWVLPGLVAAITPIRYWDVARASRGPLLTAFATGNEFVVLPLLAERGKELLREHAAQGEDSDTIVEVVVPVAYAFPHVGKLLSLSFLPFAAWFSDVSLSVLDYLQVAVTGLMALFGSISVAIPFLLNLVRLPEDLFQLFIATGVVNARFGTLAAAMHILVLSLLGSCLMAGRIRWSGLLRHAVLSAALLAVLVVATRVSFATWIDTTYRKDQILSEMQLQKEAVPAVVHRERIPAPPLPEGESRLEQIDSRGVLRVCYRPTALPFSFVNAQGQLVGFDVDMAHSLARGLGVSLELVPVPPEFGQRTLARDLRSGYCDIGMAGFALTMTNQARVDYSSSYLDMHFGFLVRDHRRSEFANAATVVASPGLRIAMPDEQYYVSRMARLFPRAEIVPIESVDVFVDAEEDAFDAMLFPAEIASAWSLLHPEFSVVVPSGMRHGLSMAYVVPLDELDWLNTVDSFIELKEGDGAIDRLYDYWIQGREAQARKPRWSIVRDVLGWVE